MMPLINEIANAHGLLVTERNGVPYILGKDGASAVCINPCEIPSEALVTTRTMKAIEAIQKHE